MQHADLPVAELPPPDALQEFHVANTQRLSNFCAHRLPTVSVGVVTANLLSLGSEIALLERSGVKVAHVDVMDGCFCPMMTVGPPFIKAIKTSLLKDVHLMIEEPLEKVAEYVAAGADIVTIHPEACSHVHRVLQKMRAAEQRQ